MPRSTKDRAREGREMTHQGLHRGPPTRVEGGRRPRPSRPIAFGPMAGRSDDQDTNGGEAEFDEGASADRPVQRPGRLERLRGGTRPAGSKPGNANVSTKWAIDRLDERERRFSFVASGAAALFGIIVYFSETHSHKALAKGQVSPQTSLALGLGAAALLLIATFVGRRAPIGFVALFTFLAFGSIVGLPFLALAAWLLYRSWKVQREAAAKVRSARAESSRSGSSSSSSSDTRPTVSSARASRSSSSKTTGKKGPATPEANKRFTPKRPLPPPPKPSRRQRKAAQTSD